MKKIGIFDDAEFQSLDPKKKQTIAQNYFNTEMADDEFKALPSERQQKIRDNFVNAQLDFSVRDTASSLKKSIGSAVDSVSDTLFTPSSSAKIHREDTTPTATKQNSVFDTLSDVKDNVGEFFSSTPPSAAEQHKPKPEQADYVNPEAEDWELGKRLVNRTNELTANAIQGTYEFLGNLKTPLNYLGLETQAEQDMNKRRADWFDDASNKLSDFVYENNKLDVKPTHT